MTLKNQIGLDGDKTPPQYMAEIPPTEYVKMESRVILDWGWLKINTRFHDRYLSPEYHVTLMLPLRKKVAYCLNYDEPLPGRRALFVAFGRISTFTKYGWHARGNVIYIFDDPVYVPPPVIGYKNPINLANY